MAIRLVAVDIDGCITPGEGHAAHLDVLRTIQEINARARREPNVPAVTLCTGRQQPFAELMCQLIGSWRPAVFENGAGLYDPEAYTFSFHPAITRERIAGLRRLRDLIEEEIVAAGRSRIQPGKERSMSLYPDAPDTVRSISAAVRGICEREGLDFFMDESILCLNILFSDIDKGTGVRWLAERLGLGLDEVAGVGDADGDLAYLDIVGFAGVPANATENVRARAAFVAPRENGWGTVDILNEIIRRNGG